MGQHSIYSILGSGVVGGFGCGLKKLGTAIHSDQSFSTSHSIPLGESVIAVDCFKADHQPLCNFLAKNKLRRTDHFSKLSLLATFLALENCGITPEEIAGDDTGILIATGYGPVGSTCSFKDSIFESSDIGASPTMFTKSVHNQASSHLAIQLGITGPNLTISQHYLSFHTALQTGCIWLSENKVKRVIVGGVDEFHDILGYSRHRFLSEGYAENNCPSLQNEKTIPGEGAGFFILEKTDGKDCPTIELPVIGKRNSNSRDPFFPSDKSVCYDNSGFTPLSKCAEDPRRFYGEFPTAPALDLGYVIATTENGLTACCNQITSEGRFGMIKIRFNSSVS